MSSQVDVFTRVLRPVGASPLAPRLERTDAVERLDQSVLDQVLGVGQVARVGREPPVSPAQERGEVAPRQPLRQDHARIAPCLPPQRQCVPGRQRAYQARRLQPRT